VYNGNCNLAKRLLAMFRALILSNAIHDTYRHWEVLVFRPSSVILCALYKSVSKQLHCIFICQDEYIPFRALV
jgi:hypothetical protein